MTPITGINWLVVLYLKDHRMEANQWSTRAGNTNWRCDIRRFRNRRLRQALRPVLRG